MKTIMSIMAAICLLAAGCSEGKATVREFIPGRYTLAYSHKYATGKDTVTIEPFGDHAYTITTHTSFCRIRNRDTLPEEQTRKTYAGIYQAATATVLETNGGAILSFDPAHHQMRWGTALYQKIR